MAENKLILIVLSNLSTGQQIERALILSGYPVILCPDKTSAQKALKGNSPAMIVLGEALSEMDGLEYGRELIKKMPAVPLLLLLEKEQASIYKTALQSGFTDVLCLPLKSKDFVIKIEEHLQRSRQRKETLLIEAHRATSNLQRRVDEFENLLANIKDGVIVLDHNNKVVLINQAARNLFKISQSPITGYPFNEVISQVELLSVVETAKIPALGIEITLEDMTTLSVALTPIPDLGLAISLHDITSLKKLDQMKSDFVSNVSHDLRSPLTAILGYVELLERAGPINDTQRGFVRHVQTSVSSITTLVDDLLNLGRIEAGLDSQKEVISINSIIRTSIEANALKLGEKKINLKFKIDEENVPVLANPVQMRQVLDNLLGNAIKYTPDQGEVGVSSRIENDQVIVMVSDTGIGIPASDRAYIFEKFYRASNVDNNMAGTGLGLSIVRSVVEAHQGRIWVDSEVGAGTTFTLLFPLA
jgi:signal transduction histidine kinase